MNITKYNSIFLIGILLSGVLVVQISSSMVNTEAFEDKNHKRNVNIEKKSCFNFQLTINGKIVKYINEKDPKHDPLNICKNFPIPKWINSMD